MNLNEIKKKLQPLKIINHKNINVTSICYNSQKCKENSLFVAIEGNNVDGNKYINDAIQNGAKVIVSAKLDINFVDKITYLLVQDTRLALAELSHIFYNEPAKKLICIGITGTNGKTTTAALVKSVLETANKKVGLIGTTGIFYGNKKIESTHTTPESLELAITMREMVDANIEYLIMEVSSHSIVQQRIAGIPFKIAAFTNLTHEHLDFHKTIDNYANAKKILFDSLDKNSIAIVNNDDSWSNYMVKDCKGIVKKIGEKNNANYKISDINIEIAGSKFNINNDTINTKLTAYFNVQNVALCYAICNELGIEKENIINGLSTSEGAIGRLQSVVVRSGATAYIDYAHTPDALEKALNSCKELLTKGRLICVFGCGGDRDKTKRPIMGKIAEKNADIVIVTDDNPRTEDSQSIINDILKGMENNVKVIANRSEAIQYAVAISNEDDIILVAGKGHENYQIIGTQKHHFSDLEELIR